jgi:hypothetical protein
VPSVTKQKSDGSEVDPNRAAILRRIKPVGYTEGGLKFLGYGRGKTGKTTLACTFPKPILLIGTEDGTKSVSDVAGVDFIKLQHSVEMEFLTELLMSGKYKSGILDQAGGFQDMILKEILGLDELPVERSWGMAGRDQWQACGQQFKERLRGMLDLADRPGLRLNVFIIAHERNFGEGSDSDVMSPSIGAALTPSAAGWLNGACDYICQTFIREEVVVKKGKAIDGETLETRKKTGKKEYCLRVGPHPVYMTGFRQPRGSVELPDVVVDPSYAKLEALIRGKKDAPAAATKASTTRKGS